MALGTYTTFDVRDPFFQSGLVEAVAQNLALFNGASNGAIRLNSERHVGHFVYDAFFPIDTSLVGARDISSIAPQDYNNLVQTDVAVVKAARKFKPTAKTLDSFKKIGMGAEEARFIMGQMYGNLKMADMVNLSIAALEAAISNVAALTYDHTATGTLTHAALNNGLAKLGDASQRVAAWVMTGKSYHDLMGNAMTDKITNVADVVIYGGSPGTFNRPVIVTDSPALHDANGSAADSYNVLGLVQGALTVSESEEEEIYFGIKPGLENLSVEFQAEWSLSFGMKGFTWDVQNGGINPDDTDLATGGYWNKVATSHKDCAGVCIIVD